VVSAVRGAVGGVRDPRGPRDDDGIDAIDNIDALDAAEGSRVPESRGNESVEVKSGVAERSIA